MEVPEMPAMKRWTVEIFIDEHGDTGATHAEARLHTGDATYLRGEGSAPRSPADTEIPETGDELAAASALSDLAHRLLRAAAEDIEQVTRGTRRVANS
jgi:hypothetical protein